MENLNLLLKALCELPDECQYVEFKHNNYEPDMIGRDISALANSAALCNKNTAYMVWGIDDSTHKIIGTDYNLQNIKVGGKQELHNWLRSMLSPNADFDYDTVLFDGKLVGVLSIHAATGQTVTFKKTDYIRIGSYTKSLRDHPAVRVKLWDRIRNIHFERRPALRDLTLADALQKLDYSVYFDLLSIAIPDNSKNIAHYLIEDGLIEVQDNGLYSITNLGAILFAKDLHKFPRLSRKSVRVVQYSQSNRLEMLRDETMSTGYAVIFEELIRFIEALLPAKEVIEGALRKTIRTYPHLAIRESIANALIHQDFALTGVGPTIELFPNRMEITNPGAPLIDIRRIIDNPPRSRNEQLADLMRRMHICEELGSGWDKIVITSEAACLPAPRIDVYEDSTRVILFAATPFTKLSNEDRLWSCYLHACIKQAQHDQLTNKSLRERFGLSDSSSATISRLIKEAMNEKLIKPLDPETAPRYMSYIPFWA